MDRTIVLSTDKLDVPSKVLGPIVKLAVGRCSRDGRVILYVGAAQANAFIDADVIGHKASPDYDVPIPIKFLPGIANPLIVILATPSLTRIFDTNNNFIKRFIERAYGNAGSGLSVDVLGAVVDQISLPAAPPRSGPLEVYYGHPYMTGMEGLSFLVTTGKAAMLNPWGGSQRSHSPSHEPGETKEEVPTLSFDLHTHNDFSKRVAGKYVDPLVQHSIQLALANTTFRNGKSSTLVGQAWTTQKSSSNHTIAKLVRERSMHEASIRIQLDDSYTQLKPDFQRWHYLTPPRLVSQSAGNVIRTLKAQMGLLGEIPASEELEAAVSQRIFRPGNEPPEFYEVWAQVTPKERRTNLPSNKSLPESLEAGDRFFKVLSGGGGWGQKRGLIALDSESTFGSSEQPADIESKPFQDLIRQGDVVRFIATWFDKKAEMRLYRRQPVNLKEKNFKRWVNLLGGTSLRFGATVPFDDYNGPKAAEREEASSEDAAQEQSLKRSEKFSEPPTAKTYPNYTHEFHSMAAFGHFGALSDQGVSVSVDTYTDKRDLYVGHQRLGNVVKTKLPPLVDFNYCESPFRQQPAIGTREFFHVPKRLRVASEDRKSILNREQLAITSETAPEETKESPPLVNYISTTYQPTVPWGARTGRSRDPSSGAELSRRMDKHASEELSQREVDNLQELLENDDNSDDDEEWLFQYGLGEKFEDSAIARQMVEKEKLDRTGGVDGKAGPIATEDSKGAGQDLNREDGEGSTMEQKAGQTSAQDRILEDMEQHKEPPKNKGQGTKKVGKQELQEIKWDEGVEGGPPKWGPALEEKKVHQH